MGGVDEEGGCGEAFAAFVKAAVAAEVAGHDDEGEGLNDHEPEVKHLRRTVAHVRPCGGLDDDEHCCHGEDEVTPSP